MGVFEILLFPSQTDYCRNLFHYRLPFSLCLLFFPFLHLMFSTPDSHKKCRILRESIRGESGVPARFAEVSIVYSFSFSFLSLTLSLHISPSLPTPLPLTLLHPCSCILTHWWKRRGTQVGMNRAPCHIRGPFPSCCTYP